MKFNHCCYFITCFRLQTVYNIETPLFAPFILHSTSVMYFSSDYIATWRLTTFDVCAIVSILFVYLSEIYKTVLHVQVEFRFGPFLRNNPRGHQHTLEVAIVTAWDHQNWLIYLLCWPFYTPIVHPYQQLECYCDQGFNDSTLSSTRDLLTLKHYLHWCYAEKK